MIPSKPRGRPQQGPQRKTRSLNLKTSDELRALIETAAAEGGRSLTQETERRLAASFGVSASAMTTEVGPLLRRLATVVDLAEQRTGKRWDADPETFWAVRAGFNDLVDRLMPDEPEWTATVGRSGAAGQDAYVDKINDWKTLGVEIARAVQPLPWRHPGHVNDDGSTTPVADLSRR
jgi:hypothetical protein